MSAPEPSVPPTEEQVTVQVGSTGLRRQGGKIDEEFLTELKGQRGIQIYGEMARNDAVVGAVLTAIDMLMRQVTWRVEPASEDQADLDRAEFLESCLNDMSETWEDTMSSILSFLPFGFSVHEHVYKRRNGFNPDDPTQHSRFDDGKFGWRKIDPRSQDSLEEWVFDEFGEIAGVIQVAAPQFQRVVIPESRFLLFRASAQKFSPEGRSILRPAYRNWYFKKRIEEIEGIGIERDLAGMPVAWLPPAVMSPKADGLELATRQEFQKLVRQVRRDERDGLLLPLAYDSNGNLKYKFELLSTGGRRQFDTSQIITRHDSRIAMSVLADFIMLGHANVGSFALASSKTDLFAIALGAWLDAIAEVFNRVAIPRLFAVNGESLEDLPVLAHDDIETQNLEEVGDYVQKLTGVGIDFSDEATVDWLRDQAGMPSQPVDEDILPPEPGLPPEPEPPGAPEPPAPAPESAPVAGRTESVLQVVESAHQGRIPYASAVSLLVTLFGLSEEEAEAILGPEASLGEGVGA